MTLSAPSNFRTRPNRNNHRGQQSNSFGGRTTSLRNKSNLCSASSALLFYPGNEHTAKANANGETGTSSKGRTHEDHPSSHHRNLHPHRDRPRKRHRSHGSAVEGGGDFQFAQPATYGTTISGPGSPQSSTSSASSIIPELLRKPYGFVDALAAHQMAMASRGRQQAARSPLDHGDQVLHRLVLLDAWVYSCSERTVAVASLLPFQALPLAVVTYRLNPLRDYFDAKAMEENAADEEGSSSSGFADYAGGSLEGGPLLFYPEKEQESFDSSSDSCEEIFFSKEPERSVPVTMRRPSLQKWKVMHQNNVGSISPSSQAGMHVPESFSSVAGTVAAFNRIARRPTVSAPRQHHVRKMLKKRRLGDHAGGLQIPAWWEDMCCSAGPRPFFFYQEQQKPQQEEQFQVQFPSLISSPNPGPGDLEDAFKVEEVEVHREAGVTKINKMSNAPIAADSASGIWFHRIKNASATPLQHMTRSQYFANKSRDLRREIAEKRRTESAPPGEQSQKISQMGIITRSTSPLKQRNEDQFQGVDQKEMEARPAGSSSLAMQTNSDQEATSRGVRLGGAGGPTGQSASFPYTDGPRWLLEADGGYAALQTALTYGPRTSAEREQWRDIVIELMHSVFESKGLINLQHCLASVLQRSAELQQEDVAQTRMETAGLGINTAAISRSGITKNFQRGASASSEDAQFTPLVVVGQQELQETFLQPDLTSTSDTTTSMLDMTSVVVSPRPNLHEDEFLDMEQNNITKTPAGLGRQVPGGPVQRRRGESLHRRDNEQVAAKASEQSQNLAVTDAAPYGRDVLPIAAAEPKANATETDSTPLRTGATHMQVATSQPQLSQYDHKNASAKQTGVIGKLIAKFESPAGKTNLVLNEVRSSRDPASTQGVEDQREDAEEYRQAAEHHKAAGAAPASTSLYYSTPCSGGRPGSQSGSSSSSLAMQRRRMKMNEAANVGKGFHFARPNMSSSLAVESTGREQKCERAAEAQPDFDTDAQAIVRLAAPEGRALALAKSTQTQPNAAAKQVEAANREREPAGASSNEVQFFLGLGAQETTKLGEDSSVGEILHGRRMKRQREESFGHVDRPVHTSSTSYLTHSARRANTSKEFTARERVNRFLAVTSSSASAVRPAATQRDRSSTPRQRQWMQMSPDGDLDALSSDNRQLRHREENRNARLVASHENDEAQSEDEQQHDGMTVASSPCTTNGEVLTPDEDHVDHERDRFFSDDAAETRSASRGRDVARSPPVPELSLGAEVESDMLDVDEDVDDEEEEHGGEAVASNKIFILSKEKELGPTTKHKHVENASSSEIVEAIPLLGTSEVDEDSDGTDKGGWRQERYLLSVSAIDNRPAPEKVRNHHYAASLQGHLQSKTSAVEVTTRAADPALPLRDQLFGATSSTLRQSVPEVQRNKQIQPLVPNFNPAPCSPLCDADGDDSSGRVMKLLDEGSSQVSSRGGYSLS
ncbi:unnamed protein product [Amoebophrya sp. A120]|nr:unnamed protein product [Amoebophrya sp. A120]|eukprot:GSA120T00015191001.1